jgi:hypothetical protein
MYLFIADDEVETPCGCRSAHEVWVKLNPGRTRILTFVLLQSEVLANEKVSLLNSTSGGASGAPQPQQPRPSTSSGVQQPRGTSVGSTQQRASSQQQPGQATQRPIPGFLHRHIEKPELQKTQLGIGKLNK